MIQYLPIGQNQLIGIHLRYQLVLALNIGERVTESGTICFGISQSVRISQQQSASIPGINGYRYVCIVGGLVTKSSTELGLVHFGGSRCISVEVCLPTGIT